MTRGLSLFTWIAAVALFGCADKTAVLIEVTSSDLAVPADVDGLRFIAVSGSGHRIDRAYPLEGTWPHSLSVLPAGPGDDTLTITVTGVLAGQPRVRRVVTTSFAHGTTRRVSVVLSRDCLGVLCGEGIDCMAGLCVGEPLDGGVDASMPDGGSEGDDAGRDGGSDPGQDGGPDGGRHEDAGGSLDAGRDSGVAPELNLMFTEYVEGSGNNKALELMNAGSRIVNLGTCTIGRFANGEVTRTAIRLPDEALEPGALFVVCHGSTDMAATRCDEIDNLVQHNGDDAYDLVCDGEVLDTFGRIGEAPSGGEWIGGGLGTEDFVLQRRCTVTRGDPIGSDPFNPSHEWMGSAWVAPATSLAGLGSRAECP